MSRAHDTPEATRLSRVPVFARCLAATVTLVLVAVACSGDGDPDEALTGTDGCSSAAAPAVSDGTALPAGATVSGVSADLSAKPTFQAAAADPAGLVVEDIVVGVGDEAVPGALLSTQYVGTLTDCSQFDASWDNGEVPLKFTLGADPVIDGWTQGVEGMRVGGRRLLVIPPELAYGANPANGLPSDATLIFVVDLVEVVLPFDPVPAGATVTGVSEDLGSAPTFEVEPSETAPTELLIEDIVVGEGEAAPPGATVEVHYRGVFTNGEEFDSSWSRGTTAEFSLASVIEGWGDGMAGMQVGGRRLLVIPPDLAYGSSPPPGLPPDATLIFVVDLVSVVDAG